MNKIDVKRFGFAVGSTVALLYLGCVVVLMVAGHETAVRFGNSLLHGLDISGIIRTDVPLLEALFGLIETFVIAWLSGASIASIYNASMRSRI
ncbi:MAG TPA: DUF5676 family membrane protein [Pyrinomonadaceae bacterium]|nr:DUF5676 family membrane protein [Pyrinomonadaceae bacterium]